MAPYFQWDKICTKTLVVVSQLPFLAAPSPSLELLYSWNSPSVSGFLILALHSPSFRMPLPVWEPSTSLLWSLAHMFCSVIIFNQVLGNPSFMALCPSSHLRPSHARGVSSLPSICPLRTRSKHLCRCSLEFMGGNMVLVEIAFYFKMTRNWWSWVTVLLRWVLLCRDSDHVVPRQELLSPFPYKADSLHLAMCPALFSEAHAFLTQWFPRHVANPVLALFREDIFWPVSRPSLLFMLLQIVYFHLFLPRQVLYKVPALNPAPWCSGLH